VQKINKSNCKEVLDFIQSEAVYNVYILGDLHHYGFENDFLSLYVTSGTSNRPRGVLMHYRDNFVYYANSGVSPSEKLLSYLSINFKNHSCISGKSSCIAELNRFLKFSNERVTILMLATLQDKSDLIFPHPLQLGIGEIKELTRFFTKIPEFRHKYAEVNLTMERLEQNFKENRVFAIKDGYEINATVTLTAETKSDAVITDVATLPQLRGTGLARRLLSAVLDLLSFEGKSRIILYVDSINATMLYSSVGFRQIGNYSTLRK